MRKTTLSMLILALTTVACDGGGAPVQSYIAPVAGQTGIPVDLALLVRNAAQEIPPDYPIDDAIRVVDLDQGGFVAGVVEIDGVDLLFTPDEAWAEGRRYAWTIDPVAHVPHGPELPLPENLVGTQAFGTSESVDVLASAIADDGQPCVVLSRPIPDMQTRGIRVTINDVEIEEARLVPLDPQEWNPNLERFPEDPYIDVYCLDAPVEVEAGATIRTWLGEEGPWRHEIRDLPVEDVVIELQRGVF